VGIFDSKNIKTLSISPDVFNFANESLPNNYPDDFEFNLNDPRPYRPKLKKYLQYDAHGDDNDDYSSHRFVIKNYRNKIKDYHPANMHSSLVADDEEEEVLDTQPTRHKPSVYRRPVYMVEDLQESDYRDSVPHESLINLKSVFQNAVNTQMKDVEPATVSHQSMYQIVGPHMPVKVNSIKHFPLEASHQGPLKPMSVHYDSAPETPIFHQPTQTYLHMPQEHHIQPHGHDHQHQQVYEVFDDPHQHQHYEMKHYHPQPYVHQGAHLIPQHNLQLEPAQSVLHPVVHSQPQSHFVNHVPFLAQHQVVHAHHQPEAHNVLDAHTILAPVHSPTAVHGHVHHSSVAGPQVVVQAAAPVPKFKKSKKRKVVKLRVRLNKKRKPHYVQKLYPVDSNYLEHHEVSESRPPVVIYRPRGAARQYSQGLVTRLHKVQPYEKKRVKRDNSVDLFTHQSIVSKEDRWVAGVSIEVCWYLCLKFTFLSLSASCIASTGRTRCSTRTDGPHSTD
jgi:hypothetical protein